MFVGIFVFVIGVDNSFLFLGVGLGYPLEDFYFEPEILESVKKNQDETSKRIMRRAKHLCDQKHVKKNNLEKPIKSKGENCKWNACPQ